MPGADLIPEASELFLGFTSTQKAGMGPGKIANFETLGYVDFRGSGYFRHGTHMHLSHIAEDLEAWYINFDFDERVATAFRPGLRGEAGHADGAAGPEAGLDRRRRAPRLPQHGPRSATARRSRRRRACARRGRPDGTRLPEGHRDPDPRRLQHARQPVRLVGARRRDRREPAAGVHFVVFNPSSDDFHRNRLAMDGVLPGGKIPIQPRARAQGFNSVLSTTHRQNFLVPPRRHRSFPLAEL